MAERRNTLVSEKLVRQKKRRRNFIFGIFGASLLFLIIVLFFIFRAPFLYINEIKVSGNEIVDEKSIQELVSAVLEENYFYVIPKKNKLVYPKKLIEQKIRKEIGRVENIDLDIEGHTLEIKIGERGSYALWCKTDNECYFIDKFGLIFSPSPVFSSGVYKVFTGVVTDDEPLQKHFLDEEKLEELEKISGFMASRDWNTEKVVVTTLRDVLIVSDKGPKIKIDIMKSTNETIKIIKTLLDSVEFKKVAKNIDSVEYIDARFGSKVFFKPKNSAMSAGAIVPSL